jgi:hypothetical protein
MLALAACVYVNLVARTTDARWSRSLPAAAELIIEDCPRIETIDQRV